MIFLISVPGHYEEKNFMVLPMDVLDFDNHPGYVTQVIDNFGKVRTLCATVHAFNTCNTFWREYYLPYYMLMTHTILWEENSVCHTACLYHIQYFLKNILVAFLHSYETYCTFCRILYVQFDKHITRTAFCEDNIICIIKCLWYIQYLVKSM